MTPGGHHKSGGLHLGTGMGSSSFTPAKLARGYPPVPIAQNHSIIWDFNVSTVRMTPRNSRLTLGLLQVLRRVLNGYVPHARLAELVWLLPHWTTLISGART